jgi:hypothetical protein
MIVAPRQKKHIIKKCTSSWKRKGWRERKKEKEREREIKKKERKREIKIER